LVPADDTNWLPLIGNNLSVFFCGSPLSFITAYSNRASNETKFVSLPVRTDVFKYSFFLRTITGWNSLPSLFVSCSRFSPSTGLCRTQHPPTIADYHGTPAVTGGLHPLLDIAPKNRILADGVSLPVRVRYNDTTTTTTSTRTLNTSFLHAFAIFHRTTK